jgi:protein PhnA
MQDAAVAHPAPSIRDGVKTALGRNAVLQGHRGPLDLHLRASLPLSQPPRICYRAVMTDTLPPCPECRSTFTYEVEGLLTCPECGHEWTHQGASGLAMVEVRDAVGNILKDGDTVTLIKDLKLKGSSTTIKVGTKVRGIRLVDGDHDIDCKLPGVGAIGLKSQFVKKVAD